MQAAQSLAQAAKPTDASLHTASVRYSIPALARTHAPTYFVMSLPLLDNDIASFAERPSSTDGCRGFKLKRMLQSHVKHF